MNASLIESIEGMLEFINSFDTIFDLIDINYDLNVNAKKKKYGIERERRSLLCKDECYETCKSTRNMIHKILFEPIENELQFKMGQNIFCLISIEHFNCCLLFTVELRFIFVDNVTLTFNEANLYYVENYGSTLVAITDSEVSAKLEGEKWTGFSDQKTEGEFKWIDGTISNYTRN